MAELQEADTYELPFEAQHVWFISSGDAGRDVSFAQEMISNGVQATCVDSADMALLVESIG